MKTIKVRIRCTACKKFDKTVDIEVNEYGYFSVTDGLCPECLFVLDQIINHHKKDE